MSAEPVDQTAEDIAVLKRCLSTWREELKKTRARIVSGEEPQVIEELLDDERYLLVMIEYTRTQLAGYGVVTRRPAEPKRMEAREDPENAPQQASLL